MLAAMLRRHLPGLALLACAPVLRAQDTPAPLTALPADATTVLYAGDVLPAIEQLLALPELAPLLEVVLPSIDASLQPYANPGRLLAQVRTVKGMIPTSLEFGCTTETIDSFYAIGLAQLCAPLAGLAVGDTIDDELRGALRSTLDESLARVTDFDAVLRLSMRSERDAEQMLATLRRLLGGTPPSRLRVRVTDESITVDLDLTATMRDRLESLGAPDDLELPASFPTNVHAELRQQDDLLLLRIGDPNAGPLPVAELGPLWTPADPPLLYQRSHSTSVDAHWEAEALLYELLEADDEAVYAAAFESIDRLDNLAELIMPCQSTLRIDDGVRLDLYEPAESVLFTMPSERTRHVVAPPLGPTLLMMDTLDSFGADVIDLYDTFVLPYDVSVFELLPETTDYMYDEESAVFDLGLALVTRAASFRGAKDLGEMPWAVGAIVAAAPEQELARGFMATLGEALRADLDLEQVPWQPTDLGLGVDTHTVDLDALAPALAALEFDCDLAPHWFVAGGHLVVSTDVALSRDLLARLQADGPDAATDEQTAVGTAAPLLHCDGDALRAIAAGAARWIDELAPTTEPQERALEALQKLAARIGELHAEFEFVNDETVRTSIVLRAR